ncbi:MAG TPA: DUF2950 family protein [Terriglobales bacterium]|nr:DUF2950 family protein [Terriglobales bacterium]
MESKTKQARNRKRVVLAGMLALAALAIAVLKLETKESALAEGTQTTFQSPAEAGAALAKATVSDDETGLARILGTDAKAMLSTGDKETDKAAMQAFAAKYEKMNRWVDMTDGSRVLYIGADNFAFPVPLAKNSSGQWYFDAVAGAEEVRARDIGRNELLAIDACSAIANAQQIYFASVGSSPQYAQRIVSTSGKQDGLYWRVSQTQPASPLGGLDEFPKSSLGSNPPQEPFAIDGYTFRILTAQGDDAPGGARSYIVNGKMIGGFAVLATPVKYGETGIMTFMTGSDGLVYERDLGPDTVKIAASMQKFDPTDDWSPVE